jgi:hypothetical protein
MGLSGGATQAALTAQQAAALKRKRAVANAPRSEPVPPPLPSISRCYASWMSSQAFMSTLEVAAAVRGSTTRPSASILQRVVTSMRASLEARALDAPHLPTNTARVKGNQIDAYIMLSRGRAPSDALRFGPQDAFFTALNGMRPPDAAGSVMWKVVMQLVQHHHEFDLKTVCPIPTFCFRLNSSDVRFILGILS